MLQPTATCLAGSHHVDKNDDVGRLQCGAGGHQPGTRTKSADAGGRAWHCDFSLKLHQIHTIQYFRAPQGSRM